jgi:hypothetical protein
MRHDGDFSINLSNINTMLTCNVSFPTSFYPLPYLYKEFHLLSVSSVFLPSFYLMEW